MANKCVCHIATNGVRYEVKDATARAAIDQATQTAQQAAAAVELMREEIDENTAAIEDVADDLVQVQGDIDALESSLNNKVAKSTAKNNVYGTNASGQSLTMIYDSANTNNAFVKRDAYGRAQFSSPSAGNDAANKTYVDTKVATLGSRVTELENNSGSGGGMSFARVNIGSSGSGSWQFSNEYAKYMVALEAHHANGDDCFCTCFFMFTKHLYGKSFQLTPIGGDSNTYFSGYIEGDMLNVDFYYGEGLSVIHDIYIVYVPIQ